MYTWHAAYSFPSETSRRSDIVITNNIYHCQTRLDCFVVPTGSEGGIKSQPERSARAIAPGVGSQIASEDKKNQGVRDGATRKQICVYIVLSHCTPMLFLEVQPKNNLEMHIKHTHTHTHTEKDQLVDAFEKRKKPNALPEEQHSRMTFH